MTLIFLTPLLLRRNAWNLQSVTLPAIALVVAAGILETGGLFAFTRGAEIGVISIVAAASTIYPVLPVLGGLLVFRERLIPTQTLGIVVVVIGLVILALSS